MPYFLVVEGDKRIGCEGLMMANSPDQAVEFGGKLLVSTEFGQAKLCQAPKELVVDLEQLLDPQKPVPHTVLCEMSLEDTSH
jgi:hypothetical protein